MLTVFVALVVAALGVGALWLQRDSHVALLNASHAEREQLLAETRDVRRAQQLEREQWALERGQLLTRLQDPSMVAAITPTSPIGDHVEPERMHFSEDDEITSARDDVLERLAAAAEAMG